MKMTDKVALKIIGSIEPDTKIDSMEKLEALLMCMRALEKQIPKKTERIDCGLHYCPCCGALHEDGRFCSNCGQALKGEVENER